MKVHDLIEKLNDDNELDITVVTQDQMPDGSVETYGLSWLGTVSALPSRLKKYDIASISLAFDEAEQQYTGCIELICEE